VGVAEAVAFKGVGVQDGDEAKWLTPANSSDLDCEAAPSAALGGAQLVTGGAATFTFAQAALGYSLCFRFAGKAWQVRDCHI
jgi:hypothetical protein